MKSDSGIHHLIDQLDALGFYEGLSEEARREAKRTAFVEGEIYADATQRVFFIDAEDVFERGAEEPIGELSAYLKTIGVRDLEFGEITSQGVSYEVILNGTRTVLWSKEHEVEEEDPWRLPTLRLLRAINVLLEEAGSEERIYYDIVANDTMVVFLSPSMHQVIASSEAARSNAVKVLNKP